MTKRLSSGRPTRSARPVIDAHGHLLVPEANALALEVAQELRRLNIPLDDGTGTWLPGLFERRCWQSCRCTA